MSRFAIILAALLLLSGCVAVRNPDPQARFWQSLSAHCGMAFAGRMVSDEAPDAAMRGVAMAMHVRECSRDTIRIPFHVGDDRSRTWVVTRTATGLRLKHDHRHQDGSEDAQTQYGGDTQTPGTATRQSFPADAYSRDLFIRGNIPQSATNVWAMEVTPAIFAYELSRPSRFFRVDFDLTRPVSPPPPPWGAR